MASFSERALPVAALVLRVFALLLLAAALIIVATDKIYGPFADVADPPNVTFRDVHAFRYVLSTAVIGCAYAVLVIPFAAIHVAKGTKRAGRTTGATVSLIFSDVVVAVLVATGAAAGLGLSVEFQKSIQLVDGGPDVDNFWVLAETSCGLMLAAVVCTVATIMISVHSLT